MTFCIDENRFAIRNPAVDDAMSDAVKARLAADLGHEPLANGGERRLVILAADRALDQRVAACIGGAQMGGEADAFDFAVDGRRHGAIRQGLKY